MKRVVLTTAAFIAALAWPTLVQTAGQDEHKHKVKADPLTGYQETPGISSTGTGSFVAEIDDDTHTLTYELRYVGLSSAAIASHIHFGNRFDAGGISAFLCGGSKPACPPGTTAEAVVTGVIVPGDVVGPAGQGIAAGEFDELIRAIRAGETYANVHSTVFPAGEIRGQINDKDQRQPK